MSSHERPTPYSEMAAVIEHLPLLVREARRARGLSLRQAGAQVGVGFNTLTRIEHGQGGTNSGNLAAVLRWLDQTPTAAPTEETP